MAAVAPSGTAAPMAAAARAASGEAMGAAVPAPRDSIWVPTAESAGRIADDLRGYERRIISLRPLQAAVAVPIEGELEPLPPGTSARRLGREPVE